MKNMVFAGESPALSLPVPSGTKSGDPVKVGGIIGVAAGDRTVAADKKGAVGHPEGHAPVNPDGTYALKVPEAVPSAGTAIYLVGSGPVCTTTASGNTLLGHTVPVIDKGVATGATKAADSGGVEGTVNVKLVRV